MSERETESLQCRARRASRHGLSFHRPSLGLCVCFTVLPSAVWFPLLPRPHGRTRLPVATKFTPGPATHRDGLNPWKSFSSRKVLVKHASLAPGPIAQITAAVRAELGSRSSLARTAQALRNYLPNRGPDQGPLSQPSDSEGRIHIVLKQSQRSWGLDLYQFSHISEHQNYLRGLLKHRWQGA